MNNIFATYLFPIISLVLSFPIALAANYYYPKISKNIVQKNLKKLSKRLTDYQLELDDIRKICNESPYAVFRSNQIQIRVIKSAVFFLIGAIWQIAILFGINISPEKNLLISNILFYSFLLVQIFLEIKFLDDLSSAQRVSESVLNFETYEKKMTNEMVIISNKIMKKEKELSPKE